MSNSTAIETIQQKIDALNHKAWNTRVQDSPKAFLISKEALELARSINYIKGIAEATRSLGFCYGRLSKNEEALAVLKESLSLFESLNDPDGQCNVIEYMGFIHRNKGELGIALKLLYKALSLAEQTGFPENLATGHYQLGVTYKHLGNYEKALEHLYQSITINREMNNSLYEAYSINVIGSIYFDNGDYDQALNYYQQGLVARQEAGDKWGEAGSLDNIGFTYLKLKDYKHAINYCNQSLAISRSTDDKRGQANVLLHLAEIYKQTNDTKQAAKFSNDSLEIRKANGDKRGEAEILLFLADLYKAEPGNDNKILDWLTYALKIAEEIKTLDLLSRTRFHLYEYYKQTGDFKEALKNLDLHTTLEKEFHKNTINQKIANLEISHEAEIVSKRNKELTELNEQIEKANAELKIESSLERVRTAAMAMHSSNEIRNVANILREQMGSLGQPELETCVVNIVDETSGQIFAWHAFRQPGLTSGQIITGSASFFQHTSELGKEMFSMYRSGEKEFTIEAGDQKLKEFTEVLINADRQIANYIGDVLPEKVYYHFATFKGGTLLTVSYQPPTDDIKSLQRRAASVFDMAYRRYLDLKKAEEQAREAEIELALERVRARTMAMQRSEELQDVVHTVFERLKELNIDFYTAIIILFEDGSKDIVWWLESKAYQNYQKILVPYSDFSYMEDLLNAKENKIDFFSRTYSFEEKNKLFDHLLTHTDLKNIPQQQKEFLLGVEFATISISLAKNTAINITSYTRRSFSEQENVIFKRFATVFDQAYTRFLDLQKAEVQAREAEIQLALERVRARTMAMQKSDELREAVRIIYEQLQHLGFDSNACNIIIIDKESGDMQYWVAGFTQEIFPMGYHVPYLPHVYHEELLTASRQNKQYAVMEYSGEMKKGFDKIFFSQTDFRNIPEQVKEFMKGIESVKLSTAFFGNGALQVLGPSGLQEEKANILKRVAAVFDLTYTRFLDLQKAEAQAREGQIELGLERVRARAMAMQHSDELKELIGTVYAELTKLNISLERCLIWIMNSEDFSAKLWMAGTESLPVSFYVPYHENPPYLAFVKAWKEKNVKWEYDLEGQIKKDWDEFIFTNTEMKHLPDPVKKGMRASEKIIMAGSFQKFGCLQTAGPERLKEEQFEVLNRFAKVFDSTYTRFNDLQKAEAQAREAQIETGLERVRSKTMAMHKSEEVTGVAISLNEELLKLGFEGGSTIIIINSETGDTDQWTGFSEDKSIKNCYVPYFKHPYHDALLDAWKTGQKFLVYTVTGEEKKPLDDHYFSTGYKIFPDNDKKWMREMKSVTFSHVFMKFGAIHWGPDHLTEEQLKILQRFSIVFEQSYTRFLDLQKAEAQTREAQIEAALERVRSRSMAMHKTDELLTAAELVYKELSGLGIISMNVSYAFVDEEEKYASYYSVNPVDGNIMPYPFLFPHTETEVMRSLLSSWKKQEPINLIELDEDATLKHQTYIGEHILNLITKNKIDIPFTVESFLAVSPKTAVIYSFNFAQGYLFIIGEDRLTSTEEEVIMRFTKVFGMTYRRFLDLKQAEAQAREAQIEAALERVRAKVMSMTNSKDLDDTSLVFGEQLRKLSIDWKFSYFWLIEEEKNNNTFWITWPDNKTSITEYTLEEAEQYFNECLVAWKGGVKIHDNYVAPADTQAWLDTFQRVVDDAGGVSKQIMTFQTFSNGVYYYDAMMKYGSFGICINKPATDEEKNIQTRFAIEFERAYTRFHDLKKAEAQAEQAKLDLVQIQHEKKRAEEALAELQSTQKQLIQTEKMASLGELTAGIAHEIQNPLNFVNNFSDVSNELIEEMKQELATGNQQQATDIAEEIKQNLEKILHHGKRADAIVKGMLQHSRSSSGVKEPTDINNLADEYLRLAFHGYRAKDKSFNAKFETNFDNTIEKINIIPQDIGRVILNLINNAFYTVNEKRKQVSNGYEPMVTVTTKKINDKIEISVKDNGSGIPQKVLDKIFQPFFTTKPTGQGTGLGLSLSYDIITKGHDGEINVNTNEGKGAEFIISLPVN